MFFVTNNQCKIKLKLKLFNTKCLFVLHQLSIIFTLILKMEF